MKQISCSWVFKVKYNVGGLVNRYKGRLLAKGYVQQHDIDYDETFVSVAKMTTIYVLFAIEVAKG